MEIISSDKVPAAVGLKNLHKKAHRSSKIDLVDFIF